MTRRDKIREAAQEYWDCNPKYAFIEGVRWADTNPIGVLDEDYVWAIYNFVNQWKNGSFGEITLQKALATEFDNYYKKLL